MQCTTYLERLVPLSLSGLFDLCDSGLDGDACFAMVIFATDVVLFGTADCSEYLSMRSRMFVDRSPCGIRLIRISNLDRRPCA